MTNWLARITGTDTTGRPTPRRDLGFRGRAVIDEVRLARLRADGVVNLSEHIMAGVVDLDDTRVILAEGVPTRNMMLARIETTAAQKLSAIQRHLYSEFDD